jgi:MFS family permease
MAGFRRVYGSNPAHLVAHVGVFFIAGWAIAQIVGGSFVINWAAWFLGAALLHDLVLLPVYSGLDRVLGRAARWRDPERPGLINYIRVPAVVAGVLLLVYFPVILGYSERNYRHDTGHALAGYTRNWLLICAGLFLASAVVYASRTVRRRRPEPAGPRAGDRRDD